MWWLPTDWSAMLTVERSAARLGIDGKARGSPRLRRGVVAGGARTQRGGGKGETFRASGYKPSVRFKPLCWL